MILNVGCGGRTKDKATFFGDIRIDIRRFPPVNTLMDAHYLGFRSSIFDEIHCYELLEHLDSPIRALREFERVLKKNGSIIISIPNVWFWRRIYGALKALKKHPGIFDKSPRINHKQAWDVHEFHNLAFLAGLKVSEVEWFNWYPPRKHKLDLLRPIIQKIVHPSLIFTHVLFKLMKIK